MQAVYKGQAKASGVLGKGQSWNEKGNKGGKVEERILGKKEVERKEARGKKKVEKEKRELAGRVARQDTLQLGAGKEVARICTQ